MKEGIFIFEADMLLPEIMPRQCVRMIFTTEMKFQF
jgi:hypothetical protein